MLIPLVMVLLAKMEGKTDSTPEKLLLGLGAAFIFIVAGVSDLVDGYFARKHQINSAFGKYFDPLADKLMILTVMIMLIPLRILPAWVVVLFLAREFAITALRGIATTEDLVIPADRWGKNKTLLQNIALSALMIPVYGLQRFGWWVLMLALIVTWGSGINYIVQFIHEIRRRYPIEVPSGD